MMNATKWILVLVFVGFGATTRAQNAPIPDDQIKTIVISEYIPSINDHPKKITETPSILDTVVHAPNTEYKLVPRKFDTYYAVDPIKSAKMEGERLDALNKLYLKGGIGNYLSAYGEGFYSAGRSKDDDYGIHVRHFSSSSSVGGTPGFSGYSDDDVNLFGTKFIGKHSLDADINYTRNSVYFYGDDLGSFQHAKDSIHQYFNCVSANLALLSHYPDSTKLNHSVKLNYYFMDDHYKTSENNLKVSGTMWRYLHDELVGMDLSADYYSDHALRDTNTMTILHLHPYMAAEGEKWEVKVGLSAYAEFSKQAPFYSFMPDAEASYDIYKHILTPYVAFEDGDVRNSYRYLTSENPFVNPDVVGGIQNTRYKYSVVGGLRGVLSSSLSYDAHASFGEVENAAFFVNDTADAQHNKFTVVYDDGTLFKAHGEIGYQKTEKLHFLVKADYIKYFLYHELHQWHTPTTRLTLSANYNLREKFLIKADLFALNEQYAPVYARSAGAPHAVTLTTKTLGPLVDANLGVEYRYSKYLSAFLTCNNIGALKYYQWNDYPTQAFNLLLGISYIF